MLASILEPSERLQMSDMLLATTSYPNQRDLRSPAIYAEIYSSLLTKLNAFRDK